MIECVTLETNHHFSGNPLAEQHKLRFRSIIERQAWDVPAIRDLEYDNYDNPAATYLVYRTEDGGCGGVSRLYPTDRPYMLQQVFSHLVSGDSLPSSAAILEGSRFCVDAKLPAALRRRIVQELVIGYLEYGLVCGIEHIVGVMYPLYWRTIFDRCGWDITWLGPEARLADGHAVRAGSVAVTPEMMAKVRRSTGISETLLSFGDDQHLRIAA